VLTAILDRDDLLVAAWRESSRAPGRRVASAADIAITDGVIVEV
jgi:hypothetical protein